MFKGTDEIPDGAFSKIVAAEGGEDNAFTTYDYTAYFQRIAADRLGKVMKMEADRMRDLRLTDAERRDRARRHPGRAQHAHRQLAGLAVLGADARGAVPEPPLRHPGHRLAPGDGEAEPAGRARLVPALLRAGQRRAGRRRRRDAGRGEEAGRGVLRPAEALEQPAGRPPAGAAAACRPPASR